MSSDVIDVVARELPATAAVSELPALIVTPHPATLQGQRVLSTRHVPMLPDDTLETFLGRQGVVRGQQWVVSIGGAMVPEAMWCRTRSRPGHCIEARRVPGKQVLMIIAIVVLSYFTLGAGGLGAGGLFAAGGAIGGGFLAAAAVFVAGSLVISKLLAPKIPKLGQNLPQANTYSLQGGRNNARLFEPMALILGEPYCMVDIGAQPYAYFEGEDQFLFQVMHVGLNCHQVDMMRIGETLIGSYDGVTLSYDGLEGGTGLTDLAASVDSVGGGMLEPSAEANTPGAWMVRTTSPGTGRIAVDVEAQLVKTNDKGVYVAMTVQMDMEFRPVGSASWAGFAGGSVTMTGKGTKPARSTFAAVVEVGQYEVRMRRVTPSPTKASEQISLTWNGLKSYQVATGNYAGQSRIGIQIKASGQLNGSLDTFNLRARAKPMPIWDGSAWQQATTRENGLSNPGAQLLLLARGIYDEDDNLIAGLGLPDEQIDIESLQQFMVFCTQKGFKCDLHLQDLMSIGDLIETVAATGMGSRSWHTGRLGVIWFSDDAPQEGVVNMGTMKAGSFSVSFDTQSTADELEFTYFDRARSNTWQSLRVLAPGVTTPTQTGRVQLTGVGDEAQAAVLARFYMAQNVYQRKTATAEVDLEHLVFRRGTVMALSHDLTQWGYSGRLQAASVSAGVVTLTLDDPVPPLGPEGQSGRFIGLRLSGERRYRIFPVLAFAETTRTIQLEGDWPANAKLPGTGENNPAHDAVWIFDFKATPGQKVRVAEIQAQGNLEGAKISLVPEGPEFWNYVWNGTYEPPPNNSLLGRERPRVENLRITAERVRQGEAVVTVLTATFDIVGAFATAQLWAGADGTELERIVGDLTRTQVSFPIQGGFNWRVEVRPFDSLGRLGVVASELYQVAEHQPSGITDLAVFMHEDGWEAIWHLPDGPDAFAWSTVVLRSGATWETGGQIYAGKTESARLGWMPAGVTTIWGALRNTDGDYSVAVFTTLTVLPPAQPVVTGQAMRQQVELRWPECRTTQPLRGYEVLVGNTLAGAERLDLVNALGFVRTELTAGTRMYWTVAIDLYGNRSDAGYVEVTTLPEISAAIEELEQGLDDAVQAILDNADAIGYVEGVVGGVQGQIDAINGQLAEVTGAPDHSTGSPYAAGSLVKSGGKLYRAKSAVPAGTAIANTTYWELIGEYASLGDAVAAHAVQLASHETRIGATEGGLTAEATARNTLAVQLRGSYTGTNVTSLTQGLVYNERVARVAADTANAQLVQGVRTDLTTAQGTISGHGTAITTLTSRADAVDGAMTVQSGRIDVVEAGVSSGGAEGLVVDPEMAVLTTAWSVAGGMALFGATDAGVPAGAPSARVARVLSGTAYNHYRRLRGGAAAATSAIRVTAGEVIDISVWVYVETAVANNTLVQAVYGTTDALATAVNLQIVTVANAWVQLRASYTVPAGATHLGLRMRRGTSTVEGPAWYCGFAAERRSAGVAQVQAAVVAEAQAWANAVQAEATARETLSANVGYDNLVRNPRFLPSGTLLTQATAEIRTVYLPATDASVPTGAPTEYVMLREMLTAPTNAQSLSVVFTGGSVLARGRPGEILDIAVWMHCSPATAQAGSVMVTPIDASGATIVNTRVIRYGTASGWQKLTASYELPAGTAQFRVYFAQESVAPAGFQAFYALPEVRRRSAEGRILAASVTVAQQATATLDGKVNASYTLSVQAGNRVAGFRVGTDGATSDFVILADRFAWAYESLGQVKYGLVLGLINGVASFGFSGNMYLDGQFTARMIGADEIRATHIRSDELETRHFKTNTLTAMTANIAQSANLLGNSALVTTKGWLTAGDLAGSVAFSRNQPNADWVPRGENTLTIHQPNDDFWNQQNFQALYYTQVAVEPGKRYEFSAYVGAHRCLSELVIDVQDASGAFLASALSSSVTNVGGGSSLGAFTRLFGFITMPAGAALATFYIRKRPTFAAGTDSWVWATRPYFGMASLYQTVPSAYSPAGQGTRIGPEGIETDSLSAISAVVGVLSSSRDGYTTTFDGYGLKTRDWNNVYRFEAGILD